MDDGAAGKRIFIGEGWSIELPAGFVTRFNPDGSWSAWDAARVVDVNLLSTAGRADGSVLTAAEMLGRTDPAAHRWHRADGTVLGVADLVEEADSGGRVFRLQSETAVENRLMQCWIAYRDSGLLDWALDVWQSIHNG